MVERSKETMDSNREGRKVASDRGVREKRNYHRRVEKRESYLLVNQTKLDKAMVRERKTILFLSFIIIR